MIEKFVLKSGAKKNHFGFFLITVFIVMLFMLNRGNAIYSFLISLAVLLVVIISTMHKQTLIFYETKIVFIKTFVSQKKMYAFDYSSIKAVYCIFLTRGGSFMYFDINNSTYKKRAITFDINHSFGYLQEGLYSFLKFLNKQKISTYSKEKEFLIKVFGKKTEINEDAKSIFGHIYHVNGLKEQELHSTT